MKQSPIPRGEALGFIDLAELKRRVPYSTTHLRRLAKSGRIPSVRLEGARKLMFSWPAIQRALSL